VEREPSTIRRLAIFNAASRTRDWLLTEEAVCVTNGRNAIYRHVHTNKIAATINLGNRPPLGSGGGVWSIREPDCGATSWSIDPAQL
jgi:hypothetical protein